MIIGQKLRELREKKGLLLRQVAAELEVDTAYISKMERGEKPIKREFIVQLAKIYDAKIDDLITVWLADQMFDIVKDEKQALKAIKQVEILIEKDIKKK